MSSTTQCPECGTRFKASQAQLEAYHGMVRCGHCQAVFNAIENLRSDESSPQLALPIELEELSSIPPVAAAGVLAAEPEAVEAGAEVDPAELAPPKPPRKPRTWPWWAASLLLLVVLLAQVSYVFRVEIAARLPGLKPALSAYCAALHCSVPLPHNAELISIESSDLIADPAHTNAITLSAILRNQAAYAQAYPNLELTLNDLNDQPLARRIFHPAEYLPHGDSESQGLAGNREVNIRLVLDTADIQAAGYRLFLSY